MAAIPAYELPDKYITLPLYTNLRIAERWGKAPLWTQGMNPYFLAVLTAYEEVRQAEERKALSSLASGLGL